MKLYATIKNAKGKIAGCGDNDRLVVELSYGNTIVKQLLFRTEKGTGGHNWEMIDGNTGTVLEKNKVKKVKGECGNCGRSATVSIGDINRCERCTDL